MCKCIAFHGTPYMLLEDSKTLSVGFRAAACPKDDTHELNFVILRDMVLRYLIRIVRT